jgi:hypothetical protein
MPPAGTKSTYGGYACHRCHKQKVKCSRGTAHAPAAWHISASNWRITERPCRTCALANQPCTYAVRDRKITIRESYLKNLEGGLLSPRAFASTAKRTPFSPINDSEKEVASKIGIDDNRRPFAATVENSTAELFVSKLKQIQISNSLPGARGAQSGSSRAQSYLHSDSEPVSMQPPKYEYVPLDFDTLRMLASRLHQVRTLTI